MGSKEVVGDLVKGYSPIVGEFSLVSASIMQEAARRLGINVTNSEVNQAGGRTEKVQDGYTYMRVCVRDPKSSADFWKKVNQVKEEIANNPLFE